jgi:hypothetical protein
MGRKRADSTCLGGRLLLVQWTIAMTAVRQTGQELAFDQVKESEESVRMSGVDSMATEVRWCLEESVERVDEQLRRVVVTLFLLLLCVSWCWHWTVDLQDLQSRVRGIVVGLEEAIERQQVSCGMVILELEQRTQHQSLSFRVVAQIVAEIDFDKIQLRELWRERSRGGYLGQRRGWAMSRGGRVIKQLLHGSIRIPSASLESLSGVLFRAIVHRHHIGNGVTSRWVGIAFEDQELEDVWGQATDQPVALWERGRGGGGGVTLADPLKSHLSITEPHSELNENRKVAHQPKTVHQILPWRWEQDKGQEAMDVTVGRAQEL